MNKNEMLPVNSYTALKDFNLAEAMNDELSGMDVSFDRVTIRRQAAQRSNCPASCRAKPRPRRNSPA